MGSRRGAARLGMIMVSGGIAVSCAPDEPTSPSFATAAAVQTNTTPANNWTPIPLGLPSGYSFGFANDINNSGVVVGDATGPSQPEPFIWRAGTGFRRLPTTPAMPFGRASAINNEGVVVGTIFATASGPRHVVLWTRGGSRVDTVPGFDSSARPVPVDINDRGTIVGETGVADPGIRAAFRYSKQNGLKYLPTLGGPSAGAVAISPNGFVVGMSEVSPGVWRSTLWSPTSKPTELQRVTGFVSETPAAVNSKGVVVGYAADVNSVIHPVVWPVPDRPEILRLPSGATSGAALAIDERGRIYGSAFTPNFTVAAVVWAPGVGPRFLPQAPTTFDAQLSRVSDCGKIAGRTGTISPGWMIWERPC